MTKGIDYYTVSKYEDNSTIKQTDEAVALKVIALNLKVLNDNLDELINFGKPISEEK